MWKKVIQGAHYNQDEKSRECFKWSKNLCFQFSNLHPRQFWDFQRRPTSQRWILRLSKDTHLAELVLPARSRVDPWPHCRPPFWHRLPRQGSHQLKEMLKEKVTNTPQPHCCSPAGQTPLGSSSNIYKQCCFDHHWKKPIIALVKISVFQILYRMQLIWERLIPKK